jgi:hypothetical protein
MRNVDGFGNFQPVDRQGISILIHDKVCWRCPIYSCRKYKSIRKSSYFARSSLPLGKLFLLMFCFLKFPKMPRSYFAEIIDVGEKSITQWCAFIRESISHYFLEHPIVFDLSHPVQIDESLFGGRRKFNRGDHQKHKKGWVFGMVQERTNRCVFWMVKRRDRKTLVSIIEDHVTKGATVKSDEWGAYKCLGRKNYNHLTVNHSLNFVCENGVHTQLIESCWSQLKSLLSAKRGTRKDDLPGYLDLYSFKCEASYEKKSSLDKFVELIQADRCY